MDANEIDEIVLSEIHGYDLHETYYLDINKATSARSYFLIKKQVLTRSFLHNCRMVCDIGCGLGQSLAHYDRIVGVDLWLPFLTFAKKHTEKDVVLADAHFLPFRDSCFDGIILHDVLEHLEDPVKALNEVCRVLQRGGKVVITTPDARVTRILYALRIMKPIGIPLPPCKLTKKLENRRGMKHIHEFTPLELTRLLRRFGIQVLDITGIAIPYIPYSLRPFTILNRLLFPLWKALDRLWDVYFNRRSLWELFILAIKT